MCLAENSSHIIMLLDLALMKALHSPWHCFDTFKQHLLRHYHSRGGSRFCFGSQIGQLVESLLQHIPKLLSGDKVWTLCENDVSCSLNYSFHNFNPVNPDIVILECARSIKQGKNLIIRHIQVAAVLMFGQIMLLNLDLSH